jgi:hypothetical protein
MESSPTPLALAGCSEGFLMKYVNKFSMLERGFVPFGCFNCEHYRFWIWDRDTTRICVCCECGHMVQEQNSVSEAAGERSPVEDGATATPETSS